MPGLRLIGRSWRQADRTSPLIASEKYPEATSGWSKLPGRLRAVGDQDVGEGEDRPGIARRRGQGAREW